MAWIESFLDRLAHDPELIAKGEDLKARLLADGSELSLSRPWMAGENTKDCFVTIGPLACYDPVDTVIALELA